MANYCYSFLEISGSVENIKRLEEFIKNREGEDGGGDKYSLDGIIPVEVDENGCYKVDDIYEVWGTKWVTDVCFQNDGDTAIINLCSAWSPPLPITLEMSRMFNLKINHFYEESGCDFEGEFEVDNGVIILDENRRYRPNCNECGEKFDSDKMIYDEDSGGHTCVRCGDELTGIVMEKIEKIKKEEDKNG